MQGTITPGNSKLGPAIFSWSIPAISTCPGASNLCRSACYAAKGFFRMPSVERTHQQNKEFSTTNRFVPWFKHELIRKGVTICRLHCAGDCYDEIYTRKLYEIVKTSPNVKFYMYTRSWRVPELLPILKALGSLPNMHLWWSVDRETGVAPFDPHIRQAYMAINDADAATVGPNVDLVFRNKPKTVAKSFNGVIVCPVENGVTHASGFNHTCTTCRLCFTRKQTANSKLLSPHIFELPAIALKAPKKRKKKKNATKLAKTGSNQKSKQPHR